MANNFSGIKVRIFTDRLGHTELWYSVQRCQPLTVDIYTVPDCVMLIQRQTHAIADYLCRTLDYTFYSFNFNQSEGLIVLPTNVAQFKFILSTR